MEELERILVSEKLGRDFSQGNFGGGFYSGRNWKGILLGKGIVKGFQSEMNSAVILISVELGGILFREELRKI